MTVANRMALVSLLLAGCGIQARPTSTPNESFNNAEWQEDLRALEQNIGHSYANLLDISEARGLNLAVVHNEAAAAISGAQDDRDAILALMRLLAVFRDGHIDFQSGAADPSFGSPVRYAIGLAADANSVVIARQEDPHCQIQKGDVVLRLDGSDIDSLLADRIGLFGHANDVHRRDAAARSLMSGRLAPKNGIVVEARHDGQTLRCELAPVSLPPTPPTPSLPSELVRETPPHEACLVMGSRDVPPPLPIDFSTQPGWRALPTDDGISAGSFTTASGKYVGVLRLAFFKATRYREVCESEWETFRATLGNPCDSDCQQRFTSRIETRLLAAIGRQVQALETRGIKLLVADVSGNGGGSSYAEAVARILAPINYCSARAFQRGPKTAAWMQSDLADMQSDLANPNLSAEAHNVIAAALPKMQSLLADAQAPCDATGVWQGDQPACRPTTRPLSTGCGLAPDTPTPVLQGAASASALVHVVGYTLPTFRYRGPLVVLVDRGSASASELFAGILQGGRRATLIGETTGGAGCGHVNYNDPLILPRSGLKVYMPNCSAFGKDGNNEVLGLRPDLATVFDALDSPDDKATKVAATLDL